MVRRSFRQDFRIRRFFSWHAYAGGIARLESQSREVRRLLDENGYAGAESILNEWNYIKTWTTDFPYSMRAIASNAFIYIESRFTRRNSPMVMP